MRILNISNGIIQWKTGKSFTKIIMPDGKSTVEFNSELVGVSDSDFERGQYKQTSDGMVTPTHIVEFVKKKIASNKS